MTLSAIAVASVSHLLLYFIVSSLHEKVMKESKMENMITVLFIADGIICYKFNEKQFQTTRFE